MTGALVDHVCRDRRESFSSARIRAEAAVDFHHERDDRHVAVLHGTDLEPVLQLVPDDGRQTKYRIGTGRRQT